MEWALELPTLTLHGPEIYTVPGEAVDRQRVRESRVVVHEIALLSVYRTHKPSRHHQMID